MCCSKKIFPQFYTKFHCIASKCPDSCCKDWDVVVDDETAEFYKTLENDFGSVIKSKMTIDGDGDRIFTLENGKCPFWNKSRLCDIYINLGEEHLCDTCKVFPRLTQDYTAFVEHMLSFACPEAARIMLSEGFGIDFIDDLSVSGEDLGYDADIMNFLIIARKKSCDFFINNKGISFKDELKQCLAFNEFVQQLIDEECFSIDKLSGFEYHIDKAEPADRKFIFDLHTKLDIMNKEWLNNLKHSSNYMSFSNESSNNDFRVLAEYYIFRYYLGAIDSFNVVNTVKRIVCAYVVISSMLVYCKAEHSFEKRVLLIQQYSKEIEHSYENSETLEERFLKDPDFSTKNLLHIL